MDNNLKQLDKLISLCRKRGVVELEMDGIKIVLGDQVVKSRRKSASAKKALPLGSPTDNSEIESESLSEQDLLFWSVAEEDKAEGETA